MSSAAHKDGREIEWQLASTDLAAVRRWLDEQETIEGLWVAPQSTLHIFDTYLDTPDWRIFRAGYALRVRTEEGRYEATLKSLHTNTGAKADRRELNEAIDTDAGDWNGQSNGPVGSRVQAVSGSLPLQPLFEVRTSRQRYAVHARHEEQQLGEIALDETVISRPNGEPRTSLQRVEVEARTAAHERLQPLVEALCSHCSLEAAADNKYSQGLKSMGLAPAPVPDFKPTTVDSTMRVEEVALANLRRFLSAWHQREPAARLGDDPEALHDLRVAGRRMDSMLRQFEAFLPAAIVRLRPIIKKVLRALGHARDLDVALLELEEFNDTLTDEDRAKLLPLQAHLHAQRALARQKMLTVLDSSGVRTGLDELRATLAHPTSLPEAQPVSSLVTLSKLIRSRYKKTRKAADRLTADSPMGEYHAVRGRVKKLRYALETVAVLFGKPAVDMVRALRRWQERLGAQQDADVAGRRLRALAMAPPKALPSETLFLMGQLAAHYQDRAWKARKRHPRAYRKVQQRWKALKSRLHPEPKTPPLGPVDSEARDRL
jgi:triphosphatase